MYSFNTHHWSTVRYPRIWLIIWNSIMWPITSLIGTWWQKREWEGSLCSQHCLFWWPGTVRCWASADQVMTMSVSLLYSEPALTHVNCYFLTRNPLSVGCGDTTVTLINGGRRCKKHHRGQWDFMLVSTHPRYDLCFSLYSWPKILI